MSLDLWRVCLIKLARNLTRVSLGHGSKDISSALPFFTQSANETWRSTFRQACHAGAQFIVVRS
jgi:hypothetical protein